jgi:hypothetical protein
MKTASEFNAQLRRMDPIKMDEVRNTPHSHHKKWGGASKLIQLQGLVGNIVACTRGVAYPVHICDLVRQ